MAASARLSVRGGFFFFDGGAQIVNFAHKGRNFASGECDWISQAKARYAVIIATAVYYFHLDDVGGGDLAKF